MRKKSFITLTVGDGIVRFDEAGKRLIVDCNFPAKSRIVSNIVW
jgi:hypothetical protein